MNHPFSRYFLPKLIVCGFIALTAQPASAVILLQTDFTGRTISGLTAQNITWVTAGMLDPGDLTAVNVAPGTLPGMFNTGNSAGHFAPDKNTGNEGPWSVTIPMLLSVPQITLDDVVLDWQHFNNSGNFQGVNRNVDWTVSVIGSASGVIATETALNVSGTSGLQTLTFGVPVDLFSSETWGLQILAVGSNTTGNNTGLDAITVNGSIAAVAAGVPEPASVGMMLSVFGAMIWLRQKRRNVAK